MHVLLNKYASCFGTWDTLKLQLLKSYFLSNKRKLDQKEIVQRFRAIAFWNIISFSAGLITFIFPGFANLSPS